jgi:flagellar L-ring protein precursor FlgH
MKHVTLLFVTATLFATGAVQADSLFPGSSTAVKTSVATSSLFADNKARRVGDTLTIIIDETASASSQAATKTSKNENLNYGPGFGPILHLIKNFGISGGISSDGSGSTNRSDKLAARIALTVKEVLPNGDLRVEGKRHVGINAETQEITLSGTVRPQDIAYDNTVSSSLVADAQIKYNGKGPVGDKQHDGIISRIFKFLF